MSDARTTYYCNTRDVTDIYKPGTYQIPIAINATSGSSNPVGQKNRIYVSTANTLPFTPGDTVLIYDSNAPYGEEAQVQSITTTYLETVADLTGNYTVAAAGKVRLLSAFVAMRTTNASGAIQTLSKPTTEAVVSLINQAEFYIETTCKRAWREKSVVEETHDFPLRTFTSRDWLDGIPIKLNFRYIRGVKATDLSWKLDTSASPTPDKLEIYGGGTWMDWATVYTGGRSGQYWIDPMRGMLYLRSFYKIFSRLAVRVTYRYGETTVPADIKRAAALLVASHLSEAEDNVVAFPAGEDINIVPVSDKAARWREQAEKILERYREQVNIW